jgi:hypothetical protein
VPHWKPSPAHVFGAHAQSWLVHAKLATWQWPQSSVPPHPSSPVPHVQCTSGHCFGVQSPPSPVPPASSALASPVPPSDAALENESPHARPTAHAATTKDESK